jgi:hypothetical protein
MKIFHQNKNHRERVRTTSTYDYIFRNSQTDKVCHASDYCCETASPLKILRQNLLLLIEENNLIPFFPFCVISVLMIVVVIERIMMIRVLL